MIFRNHNVIFLHVQRTAGTSMEGSLARGLGYSFGGGDWDANLVYGWHDGIFAQHATLHEMIDRRYCTRRVAFNAFKFCFVRNPFDRLLSYYTWTHDKSIPFALAYPLFDHFVASFSLSGGELYHPLLPQTLYSCDCDFVGRYERIVEDWEAVCSRVGVRLPLGVLNRSSRGGQGDYRAHYSDASRRRVESLFADELTEYGYEF